MDDEELARRRTQMGESVSGWASGPGAVGEIGEGYWLMLTGAPSPDVNLALVHAADPKVLTKTLDVVESTGYPTIVCMAGPAAAQSLPAPWQQVGSMPFMSVALDDTPVGTDPRVRRALAADDADKVRDLTAEAYGMDPAIAEVAVAPVRQGDDRMRFWLLEDDGVPVSTVLTSVADDAVSIWGMSTPARFGRRGYGRALLAHVLAEAYRDGARVGLLGATPAGLPLYAATGWQTLEEWQLFVNAASVQFGG